MAIYSNLTIDQGSDFSTEITVEDATGEIADLTGYTAAGQIRKTYTSINYYEFICTIPNPLSGIILAKLPNTLTNDIKAGRYVYDIEIRVGTIGDITRVVEGQIEVTPGVTR